VGRDYTGILFTLLSAGEFCHAMRLPLYYYRDIIGNKKLGGKWAAIIIKGT